MIPQDLILTGITIILTVSLLPQVYDVIFKKRQLNLCTAGLTALCMGIIAVTHFSLDCVFTAASETLMAALWLSIGICSWKNRGISPRSDTDPTLNVTPDTPLY